MDALGLGLGAAGLWSAVLFSGIYHGLNPGMGWPLAVSAGLMARRDRAVVEAVGLLGLGHLAAMTAILLPFAVLGALVEWQREIRIGAGLLVIALGLWLLIQPRHPRFLARVPPGQLALWSFLIAIVHGAGLMLVPVYLGLCGIAGVDPSGPSALSFNLGLLLAVALTHTGAMFASGGGLAWAVYRVLGLGALRRTWFDLDRVWAASLILVGVIGVGSAW